jgi:hypothetical protein
VSLEWPEAAIPYIQIAHDKYGRAVKMGVKMPQSPVKEVACWEEGEAGIKDPSPHGINPLV